jgi:hypothetical protein
MLYQIMYMFIPHAAPPLFPRWPCALTRHPSKTSQTEAGWCNTMSHHAAQKEGSGGLGDSPVREAAFLAHHLKSVIA